MGQLTTVDVLGIAGHLGGWRITGHWSPGSPRGRPVRVADGGSQPREVSGGFFEVSNNRATVLADGVAAGVAKA